ncbi:hypothetical protein [Brevundimonas aurantiaca]|uniref:hypothetical protein n=1 Tax=Brevundimonas aurantiaca TaxID=74316 RepID=UPI001CD5E647|nr:hypothetical protein [Brevundimonas aurantiaca]
MAVTGAVADTDVAVKPMARGRVALVLIALAMGGFAIGVTEFAAMSILPDFAAGLGVDAPTAGHVISAYAAGVVVGAHPGGAGRAQPPLAAAYRLHGPVRRRQRPVGHGAHL